MAVTNEISLTSTWQAVATAGEVLAEPGKSGLFWAITGDASAPSFASGHSVKDGEKLTATLTGTERLWLKGRGVAYVTRDGAP